ncbi:MAG TPA: ABC transporter ATP-binding protein [Solirubrobacteraceae bacterium]|jgi:ABC-type multidrug transport system ATPase subunit|nr:ABC transporter ATP-binding protein [Solirubrobacteraceae bacterium]
MTVLEAVDLVASYGDHVALNGLTYKVRPGSRVALIGPNGAGKSTFLRLAAGLLEPTSGEVTIDGFPAGSIEARKLTSYLPDTPSLYDDLSLVEHLEYVARLHGETDWEDRANDLLDRLGLTDRAQDPPGGFSKGMRQKASIAVAFVRPFGLILADEPFDGLDPPSREALDSLFAEAAAGGASVVLATHHLEIVERASRCLAIDEGEVVYDGRADTAEVARLVGTG